MRGSQLKMTGKYGKDTQDTQQYNPQDTKYTQDTHDTQLDEEHDLFGGSPIKVSSDEDFPHFPDRLCEDEMDSPFKYPFVGMTSTLHDFIGSEIQPSKFKFETTPESKKVTTGDLCKAMLAHSSPLKKNGGDQDSAGYADDEDTLKLGDTPPTPRKRPRVPADFGAVCSTDRPVQFRRLNAADFS
jgi:hypothetical protein